MDSSWTQAVQHHNCVSDPINPITTNINKVAHIEDTPHVLDIVEIVKVVFDYIDQPADCLRCARVNSLWNALALRRLYKGSVRDMRWRTPDITALNCLWTASAKRFEENMSFIEHLVIAPYEITKLDTHNEHAGKANYVCIELCRPLRGYKGARSFLQSQRVGLLSIAIPFKLICHDLFAFSALILRPSLQSLTIPQECCNELVLSSRDCLSGLRALTIHRSNNPFPMHGIGAMLQHCHLKFFNIQDQSGTRNLQEGDTQLFLSALSEQCHLQSLALATNIASGATGRAIGRLAALESQILWPHLKALYLENLERGWIEHLSAWKDLNILEFSWYSMSSDDTYISVEQLVPAVSALQALQAIQIHFLPDASAILDIARSCRLLRKLELDTVPESYALTRPQLLELTNCLPLLEILSAETAFLDVTAEDLGRIAKSCPNLLVLDIQQTHVHLNVVTMAQNVPFHQLEYLLVKAISFDDPVELLHPRQTGLLAREWVRSFPKLRSFPYDFDDAPSYISGEYSGSEPNEDMSKSEYDSLAHGQAAEPSSALSGERGRLKTDQQHRATALLIQNLSRQLNLEYDDERVWLRCQRWQTDFEIQLLGWPVVPLTAWMRPDQEPYCGPPETA